MNISYKFKNKEKDNKKRFFEEIFKNLFFRRK